ncbi:hypothetical protein N8D56_26390 (plasmid) [Devosia sp. A8/3-2]|nr:hypothetical protein N8D56_26390 [Devosia sp. A8/3-2]
MFTALAVASGSAFETPAEAPFEMKHEPSALWSRSVAMPTPSPSSITIEGVEVDGRFVPQAVNIDYDGAGPGQAPKTALPLGENLIGRLPTTAFRPGGTRGSRVVGGASGSSLQGGDRPAGVVLETGTAHFPREASLTLVVAGLDPTKPVGLSVVQRGADAPTPSQAQIGADGRLNLQFSPSLDQADAFRGVVISCPPGEGSFRLDSISLEPDRPASRASRVGTWLWTAETWLAQPGQIESWAVSAQLDRVFLQLKIANGEVSDGTALANSVRRLRKRGISVHAVEGDPAMITAEGLDNALRRVAAIRHYQVSAQPDTRLGGLQFDIEPYLLADFARDPAATRSQWAEAIHSLSSAWGEPVSVVVPFWMLNSEAGTAAAAAAHPVMSDLTVMAYRTQIGEVSIVSEPWLAWGTLNGVPVRIAIENGPLGVEVHRTFIRAETGIVLLKMEGRVATISLFSEPVEASQDALAYAFHRETRINPGRISFMNDGAKLAVARAELARLLVARPSFDGLMIHALHESDHDLGRAPPIPEARANEPQAPDTDL